MVLNIDLSSLKVLAIAGPAVSEVQLDATEDDGKTFTTVIIRYNPMMMENDILKVVQAELDRMDRIPHPSEVMSRIASTLTTRGKVYDRAVKTVVKEVI